MAVVQVTAWKTSDGQLFESPFQADGYDAENDHEPIMSAAQHHRLLIGILNILNDRQWNGCGQTVLESLQVGIAKMSNQSKDLKQHIKDLNGILRKG